MLRGVHQQFFDGGLGDHQEEGLGCVLVQFHVRQSWVWGEAMNESVAHITANLTSCVTGLTSTILSVSAQDSNQVTTLPSL